VCDENILYPLDYQFLFILFSRLCSRYFVD